MSILGTLSPNVSSQNISSSPTFQTPAAVPGNMLNASVASLLVTTSVDINDNDAKTTLTAEVQYVFLTKSNCSYFVNMKLSKYVVILANYDK